MSFPWLTSARLSSASSSAASLAAALSTAGSFLRAMNRARRCSAPGNITLTPGRCGLGRVGKAKLISYRTFLDYAHGYVCLALLLFFLAESRRLINLHMSKARLATWRCPDFYIVPHSEGTRDKSTPQIDWTTSLLIIDGTHLLLLRSETKEPHRKLGTWK